MDSKYSIEKKMFSKNNIKNKIFIILFAIINILYIIIIVSMTKEIKSQNTIYILYIVNFIYFFTSFISVTIFLLGYKRFLRRAKEYNYYRDLKFNKINATVSGVLLKKKKIDTSTVILAVYELAEKNFIGIKEKNKKEFVYLKTNDKNKFNKLFSYDKKIVLLFFDSLNDKNEYDLEEIFNSIKRKPKKEIILTEIKEQIRLFVQTKFKTNFIEYLIKDVYSPFIKLVILSVIPIVIFGIYPTLISDSIILMLEYIFSLILFLFILRKKFIKKEYQEEVQNLYGLYAYMIKYKGLDINDLDNNYLCNKYHLYFIGLGADEVLKRKEKK